MARQMPLIEAGQRYGMLTVETVPAAYDTRTHVLCRCDCGNEASVIIQNLRRNATRSCGCFRRERMRTRIVPNKTHGLSGTRIYRIWGKIISRCEDPRDPSWDFYGARGIRMCDAWRESVTTFAADMGPMPSARHQIDRIDSDGDYTPENCRWATTREQARNRSNNRWLTHDGETRLASEWAQVLGISRSALHGRMKRRSLDEIIADAYHY